MKTYEIIIKPESGFGTPLKGDTIFGHFCWRIAYDSNLSKRGLEELLSLYHATPFAVFSSAYPKIKDIYALKMPSVPLSWLFNLPDNKYENIKKRKELEAKCWMLIQKDRKYPSLVEYEYADNTELLELASNKLTGKTRKEVMRQMKSETYVASFNQSHNTINRLTGTTGEDNFAPFSVKQQIFYPGTELSIFVGIDESMVTIDQIKTGLERIGQTGFGKDASTGLGRFTVCEDAEISLSEFGNDNPHACYTLSPSVPQKDTFINMFFSPFTRFGKHGDILAKSRNPFKNPVIMADEGAVLIPKSQEIFKKPYIGMAIPDVSRAELKTVVQGYSLYVPVRYTGEKSDE